MGPEPSGASDPGPEPAFEEAPETAKPPHLRGLRLVGPVYGFFTAEISNSSVTLSLTRTPPVSSVAFHVMP
jgi:hypothetical protein